MKQKKWVEWVVRIDKKIPELVFLYVLKNFILFGVFRNQDSVILSSK